VDREAAARAIADEAKRGRRPTPRWLWILSLVVAAACFGALAIGWIEHRDATADHRSAPRADVTTGGFGVGLVLGIGVGALAATAVLRRR
jgi:predicted outer membrane lipoprotein